MEVESMSDGPRPSIRIAALAWFASCAPCASCATLALLMLHGTALADGGAAPPVPSAAPTAPRTAPTAAPRTALPVPASGTCEVRVVRLEKTRPADQEVEPGPAVVAGAIVYTRVDVELDGATLQQALTAIGRAARVNLVGIYRRSEGDPGLDRTAPVFLSLRDVPVHEALDHVLSATTGMIDSTWQIRGNVIECGPKAMLAEPGRRETRVHDISDLRFEIPRFVPGKNPDDPSNPNRRRNPKEICADLARLVMNSTEAKAWEEPNDPDPASAPSAPSGGTQPATPSGFGSNPGRLNTTRSTSRNLDPDEPEEIFVFGRWASMQFRDNRLLVVHAPDFIHRQIAGYGKLVPPTAP